MRKLPNPGQLAISPMSAEMRHRIRPQINAVLLINVVALFAILIAGLAWAETVRSDIPQSEPTMSAAVANEQG